jgi:hypothetical protein
VQKKKKEKHILKSPSKKERRRVSIHPSPAVAQCSKSLYNIRSEKYISMKNAITTTAATVSKDDI